jgi:hypothetical protein
MQSDGYRLQTRLDTYEPASSVNLHCLAGDLAVEINSCDCRLFAEREKIMLIIIIIIIINDFRTTRIKLNYLDVGGTFEAGFSSLKRL